MPFKKQSNGTYKSPSGKVMTKEQVRAYYASKSKPISKKPNNR